MTTVKQLYTLASKMGLVHGEDDAFHQIVHAVAGKEHVSELTAKERESVFEELQLRNRHEQVAGMMTEAQQRYAWRLVYRLKELDTSENPAPVNERLAGAVQKILGITASPKDPLRWVNFQNGSKLIEMLKRYVKHAEQKAVKQDDGTARIIHATVNGENVETETKQLTNLFEMLEESLHDV